MDRDCIGLGLDDALDTSMMVVAYLHQLTRITQAEVENRPSSPSPAQFPCTLFQSIKHTQLRCARRRGTAKGASQQTVENGHALQLSSHHVDIPQRPQSAFRLCSGVTSQHAYIGRS